MVGDCALTGVTSACLNPVPAAIVSSQTRYIFVTCLLVVVVVVVVVVAAAAAAAAVRVRSSCSLPDVLLL